MPLDLSILPDQPAIQTRKKKLDLSFLPDQPFGNKPLIRSLKETGREFAIAGPFSPRFQRETSNVAFAPINISSNILEEATRSGIRPGRLFRAAKEAAPFGGAVERATKEGFKPERILEGEGLTEPINLRPTSGIIKNVVKKIAPTYTFPEKFPPVRFGVNPGASMASKIPVEEALNLAGFTLAGLPLGVLEGGERAYWEAARRSDLLRATKALKNEPERVGRLRGKETIRRFGIEAQPKALPFPERLGETFKMLSPVEALAQRLSRKKLIAGPLSDELGQTINPFGKSFEGLTEEELQKEISRLKGEKKFPEKATIRVEKFGQPQRPGVEAVQEAFDISAKTRGRMSIQEINARAREGKITVEELAKLPEGTALPAEELQRARGLTQEAIGTADQAISRFLQNPADETILADALTSVKSAVDTLTSTRAAMGEAGRSLRILRESVISKIKLPSEAKQILENINKDQFLQFATQFRDAIKNGRTDLAAELLKQQTKRSFWNKIVDFSNALLLTNPQTDIANTVGNTLANLVMTAEKAPIAAVDKIRSILTHTPRERFLGETQREAFSIVEGIKSGAVEFMDVLLGKKQELGKIAEVEGGVSPKKGLDRISDFIFRRLGAEDVFFKSIKREQSMNAQAFRIAKKEGLSGVELASRIKELRDNPTHAMLEEANKSALEATFQEPLGEFTRRINSLRQFPPVRFIFPFFRTLINITKFASRRSPLALTPGTRSFGQIKGIEGAGAQSEAIGKALMGTIASIPVALLAAQGMITGSGPKDRKEKELLQAQGWQPFAIRAGNKYISYRRAEPLSTFLATVSTLVEGAIKSGKELDSNAIGEAISSSTGFISDQTFWRGLRELIDFARGRNPEFITRLVTGRLIPPGVAFLARSIEPEFKEPKGFGETAKSRIPFLSKTVHPRLDIFGRPVKTEGLLNRMLPFRTTKFHADPVAQELLRLDIGISKQGKTYMNLPLTEDQIFNINQVGGKISKEFLDFVVDQDTYKNLDDLQKKELLEKIIREAKKGARVGELLSMTK